MAARHRLTLTLCIAVSAAIFLGTLPLGNAFGMTDVIHTATDAGTDLNGSSINSDLVDDIVDDLLGRDDDDDDDDEGEGDDDHDGGGDRPRAYDQSVELDEDKFARIELEGRGDEVTFSITQQPENGKLLELDESSGKVTYEPDPNFFGLDSFSFVVSDGEQESWPAVVSIHVESVNDSPVAIGAEVTTTEGKSTSIQLRGSDVENDDLDFVIMSEPSHGTLSGDAPDLIYEPDKNFEGSDELTFSVDDGSGESDAATITIKVKEQDRPREKDDSDKWWLAKPAKPKPASEPAPSEIEVEASGTNSSSTQSPDPAEPPAPGELAPPPVTNPVMDEKPIASPISAPKVVSTPAVPIPALTADALAPQLVLPRSLVEFFAGSTGGAQVFFEAKAIDGTDGEVQATCSPGSGSILPIGKFNVVCRAQDAAGNTAVDSFTLVVKEGTAPRAAVWTSSLLFTSVMFAGLATTTLFGLRNVIRRMYRR